MFKANFDKAIYINLDERTDRKNFIENELSKSNLIKDKIYRFSAIDGKKIHPKYISEQILSKQAIKNILDDEVKIYGLSITQGALGLILTYLAIFEQLSNSNFPIITFEDDVTITNDFDEYLSNILNELPQDFDLCYLGYCPSPVKKQNFSASLFIPEGPLHCTPALVISPKGAKKIINLIKNIEYQIDTILYQNFSKLNVFASNKSIATGGKFDSSIQGNKNNIKNYKKQNYIFSTLAVGEFYNNLAVKLSKDLNYFKQNILIVTDRPDLYQGMSNVIVKEYPNKIFSYNDKIIAFKEALLIEDCVVYTDCDSRVLYENYEDTFSDFCTIIPKGFHPSWSWGKINLQKENQSFFNSTDINSRLKGYGEKCLELCKLNNFNYKDAEHWQESFLILSKENGKEQEFLKVWEKLAFELDNFEVQKNARRIGIGEGNLIGIAAATSNITINNSDMCNLLGDHVRYNCHHRLESYFQSYPKKKKVDYSDYKKIIHKSVEVLFKEKIIDLEFEILDSESFFFVLNFKWNKNNIVGQLDHEFIINNEIFHFQSEKQNSFIFKKINPLKIYHTYDWYGEKEIKEIL